MAKYTVVWTNQQIASSPVEAARLALGELRSTCGAVKIEVCEDKPYAHRVGIIIEPRKATSADDSSDTSALLRDILQAAAQHGNESEPDREVGDLQEALALAWDRLSRKARREVYKEVANGPISTWLEMEETEDE